MSGLERIVVGYRQHDRRKLMLADQFGLEAVGVRKCMAGCGYIVHFYSGGVAAVVERDAEVICTECKELYYPQLIAEL